MMIMTDITLKKDLENKVEMERNILKMVVKAVVHHDDFMDNVRSFREFCEYRIFELVGSDRSFKDIVFEIIGGNILVESERFFDFTKSLTHVFRNCIDHGIEPMDERVELGKEEQGRIGCSILAKEDTIVIQISDDGRDIDLDMLKEKALEKGIYEEAYIDRVSKEEILSLVFRDDFSTKEQTSELSGRGVGLAAVMKELEKLNGKVEVKTEPNNGTEFRFIFPYEM